MAKYELTNKAVDDLNQIWEYTVEKWSEQQADIYYKILLESCQNIANNLTLGKKYNGVKNELYGFKVNKHIIFYRVIKDRSVEITRILHGRMDLEERTKE